MSLITPEEAQAQGIGLALSTSDLQALIDREEAELVRMFGLNAADAPITDSVKGGQCNIYLTRAIESVTSIAEYLYLGDAAPVTLATTDYYRWGSEGRIERIATASRWGALVTVQYTPVDDTELRRMVMFELVRIAADGAAGNGGTVSGLSFSLSGGGGAAQTPEAARSAQYARLGWLSR